ncbi:GHSR-like protein [Mya arenaria]|uniref:GHSR-like protein n=1 Tax=Mya arenaria TaxID=6604 RepID=A0ABY7ERQ6_MYAAR|nr:probable G-protein coupled receptor 139 [Mya arenaria]WAR11491.1 GHSR-like protein [Mya arenaria]
MSYSEPDTEMHLSRMTPASNLTSTLYQILMALQMDPNMTSEILALTPEDQLHFIESLNLNSDVQSVDLEDQRMLIPEYRINKAIGLYLPPFLLLMGTFGNVMTFLILRNKAMTRQSTNLFLAALAIADSIVLFVGLLRRWLGDILQMDIQSESDWLCKAVSVLGYSSSQFSVWLIIAVTIERFLVVSHPLHTSRYCNLTRAKRIICLIAFLIVAINFHFLFTVSVHEHEHGLKSCDSAPQFRLLVTVIWPWIDASLYALLPFLLIVVCNTLIIIQTLKATIWREAQNGPLINTADKRKVFKDNNIKLTVMLLSVSFTFLITTFPMAIVMVFHSGWSRDIENVPLSVIAQRQLIRTSAEMLMFLNHSVNFYLYCALGQKFRNQVLKTLCRRTLSTNSNLSDHSQHLYCSRVKGYHVHNKSTCFDETNL